MNWTELLGFITGAICVWLQVKENVWNWPAGIANNIFYVIVFWHSGLYADSLLQWFYISISIYGWWNWLHGGLAHSRLKIDRTSHRGMTLYIALSALGTILFRELLRRYTNSTVPLWDGLTTAMSLTAQYMLTRKLIENWWWWIAVDVIYIALYMYKRLYLTSVLYAIFLGMCIIGLREWQRRMVHLTASRADEAPA
ncbi:MAG: nicotinamide mononucleotide transporter [Acidobacteria bacterium]|nr:MAG: nicotinamide mononucleotide transporter [Acidobacteriota bacterium]